MAIDGLRDEGFELEELIGRTQEEAENQLREQFSSAEDVPIIVTLKNPALPARMDHAVVVIDIRRVQTAGGEREIVEYFDPLTGDLVEDTRGAFWFYWDAAGQRAFILRP